MKIIFEVEEIEELLRIGIGEIQRYEDIIQSLPKGRNSFGFEIMKAKYEGKVKTLKEMLEFGRKSEI